MKKYILRRTLWLIITFIAAFMFAFFIYNQLLGNILVVDDKTLHKIAKSIPKIRSMYNLDAPIYIKLVEFCKKLFTNKLVIYSLYVNQPPVYVMPIILQEVKTNLALIFSIMIFGSAVSIMLGIRLSRCKKQGISSLIMYLGMSIPAYILSVIIFFKYSKSDFFYNYMASHSAREVASFNGNLKSYVIPFVTLSIFYIAQCTKRIKVIISEINKKEFITTAYAYGCSRREVEYKYVLKNASISIITFIGSSFSLLFSELIVVQVALGSSGFGAFFLSMVYQRQYDAVFACVVFIIAVAASFNYLVDLLYFVVDPRIKAK